MGASLLVFLNKTDVEGCMTEKDIREVCLVKCDRNQRMVKADGFSGKIGIAT